MESHKIHLWLQSSCSFPFAAKYSHVLVDNGFDDLEALEHLDAEDLDDLDIDDPADRALIIAAVARLPGPDDDDEGPPPGYGGSGQPEQPARGQEHVQEEMTKRAAAQASSRGR